MAGWSPKARGRKRGRHNRSGTGSTVDGDEGVPLVGIGGRSGVGDE